MAVSVVAIGAHPDDVEHSCLGTLLRYREEFGATIVSVSVSNGERGSMHRPDAVRADVVAVRGAESQAVADALDARYVCLGQPDQYVRDSDDVRDALVDVLREARADVVLAPPPVDYHLDHMVTSKLATHAAIVACNGAVATAHEALDAVPATYYVEPVTGLQWQPTQYVDISRVFARKCELLALHESQMQSMRRLAGWDLVRYAEVVNAFRGLQCGVEYAEGFAPALAWPRVRPGSALP